MLMLLFSSYKLVIEQNVDNSVGYVMKTMFRRVLKSIHGLALLSEALIVQNLKLELYKQESTRQVKLTTNILNKKLLTQVASQKPFKQLCKSQSLSQHTYYIDAGQ